ncbi:MAG: hypothetical protein H6832_15995 [Planctomycetes bacterium]|nr:hypothetical protein [Planctomycetota bacterium]
MLRSRLPSTGAVLALALLAGCETLSRPFTSEAKFGAVGGAIQPLDAPEPDDAVYPGGLEVRIDSTLASDDETFIPSFVEELRKASGGRYRSMMGINDKKPQFSLFITEMQEGDGRFEGNKLGAVIGAAAGAGTGIAVGGRGNRTVGGVIGAGAGAAAGYVLTGEKKNVWAFEVEFRQRTGATTKQQINTGSRTGDDSGGGVVDRDSQTNSSGFDAYESSSNAQWDLTTQTIVLKRYFTISAQSGIFHTLGARKNRVREMILQRVPSWLMGGTNVGF